MDTGKIYDLLVVDIRDSMVHELFEHDSGQKITKEQLAQPYIDMATEAINDMAGYFVE